MRVQLTPQEARVIGSLIEKEVTTPDQYPLSLNSLTTACNQKSNRDPVMQLSESQVQDVVDSLRKKHLISDRGGFGSRVTKYQHRFCNTGFGGFEFTTQEVGLICVLLLRGAQTPGELRSRTNRLCEFSDVQETERVLQHLMEREDGPFVVRLPREPGKRESRYRHLFGDEEVQNFDASTDDELHPEVEQSADPQQLQHLEELVESLQARVESLEERIELLEQLQ